MLSCKPEACIEDEMGVCSADGVLYDKEPDDTREFLEELLVLFNKESELLSQPEGSNGVEEISYSDE